MVGAGSPMLCDPLCYRLDVAPRDQTVDEAIGAS
ncbi:MAG: hypothetical protein QOF28_129, partial [Actinomycetota bacterium]|nr:hypothetical protein [Actinomycetota bacterium]